MQIREVIERLKKYHRGYGKIDESTTRDQILYGNPDQECVGIVVCIWPSIDVIKEALKRNANLIVSHEALFWNHGDHQKWLQESQNQTYLEKKALLDQGSICVWRDHDYIHSGIPMEDGKWVDGIFYGLAKQLDWSDYLVGPDSSNSFVAFELPETTLGEAARTFMKKLDIDGLKMIGKPEQKVRTAQMITHVLGGAMS